MTYSNHELFPKFNDGEGGGVEYVYTGKFLFNRITKLLLILYPHHYIHDCIMYV